MTNEEQKNLANEVIKEIAELCKFYDVEFSKLTPKEIDMYVAIFQQGIKFIEAKREALQSPTTN